MMGMKPAHGHVPYWQATFACNEQQRAGYVSSPCFIFAFCNANISGSDNFKLHDQFAEADNTELRFCGFLHENVSTRKALHAAAAADAAGADDAYIAVGAARVIA
jgi:hypothetical protein